MSYTTLVSLPPASTNNHPHQCILILIAIIIFMTVIKRTQVLAFCLCLHLDRGCCHEPEAGGYFSQEVLEYFDNQSSPGQTMSFINVDAGHIL